MYGKWFWISGLYDYKRDIVLNGMILSGTHCMYVFIISDLGMMLQSRHLMMLRQQATVERWSQLRKEGP